MGFTPIILLHLAAALAALAVGAAMFWMRKGTRAHRLVGRSWVLLMVVTALSSFWIKTSGHWSWIHLLSIGVLAGLAAAIHAVIHGDIRQHKRLMSNIYVGGLIVAGFFTLLPSRLLGQLVWGKLGLVAGA